MALVLVGTGLLLVSTLPVWSFKNFKVPAPLVLPILLGTGVFAAILLAEPWAGLAGAGVIYVAMLPFSAAASTACGTRPRPCASLKTRTAEPGGGCRHDLPHLAWLDDA